MRADGPGLVRSHTQEIQTNKQKENSLGLLWSPRVKERPPTSHFEL